MEEDLNELARLTELEQAMEEFRPDEAEYLNALEEASVSSMTQLQKKITQIQQRIDKTKAKIEQSKQNLDSEMPPEVK